MAGSLLQLSPPAHARPATGRAAAFPRWPPSCILRCVQANIPTPREVSRMTTVQGRPAGRLPRRSFVLAALAIASVIAFAGLAPLAHGQAKPVVVFAAASLKNALDDAVAQYEKE